MEIIKNYLDTMFTSLPDADEVRRAKEELYQMMEDKYLELKSEGRSENEAIGIVIANFGNIDELKEELCQEKEPMTFAEKETEVKKVSLSQAREYVESVKRVSVFFAAGVMLCICSPAFLIFLSGLSEIHLIGENVAGCLGLLMLFGCIAIAVALFLYSDSCMSGNEYLKEGNFILDDGVGIYVENEKKGKRQLFSTLRIAGVILCICSVMPLLGFSFLDNGFISIITVCLLLLLVGMGAALLSCAGKMEESYQILMKEEDFKRDVRKKKKQKERLSSVYWCMITAVYLGWSFWSRSWGITWIIWPVAGVLYGAVSSIFSAILRED